MGQMYLVNRYPGSQSYSICNYSNVSSLSREDVSRFLKKAIGVKDRNLARRFREFCVNLRSLYLVESLLIIMMAIVFKCDATRPTVWTYLIRMPGIYSLLSRWTLKGIRQSGVRLKGSTSSISIGEIALYSENVHTSWVNCIIAMPASKNGVTKHESPWNHPARYVSCTHFDCMCESDLYHTTLLKNGWGLRMTIAAYRNTIPSKSLLLLRYGTRGQRWLSDITILRRCPLSEKCKVRPSSTCADSTSGRKNANKKRHLPITLPFAH